MPIDKNMQNSNKPINIDDIARMANVSKSTVSRYLNKGSVSKNTSEKIEAVITQTNYSPNSFAQSLKAKRTNLIGTVVPRLDSFSLTRTLEGVDSMLNQANYELLILNTYQDPERELEALRSLVKQKVAGIIYFATILTSEHIELLKQIEIPVIVIGQEIPGQVCVLSADYEAGKIMGDYAYQLGHRNIAYFGVTEKDAAVGRTRKNGVFDALSQYDIQPAFYETKFKIQDAYGLAMRVLPQKLYSYIICATDNIAIGVLKAARELKIQLPEELSISGFGDDEITDAVSPTITTMHYDYQKIGRITAQYLIQENLNPLPLLTYVNPYFKAKESTREVKL